MVASKEGYSIAAFVHELESDVVFAFAFAEKIVAQALAPKKMRRAIIFWFSLSYGIIILVPL